MTKINLEEIGKRLRTQDVNETLQLLKGGGYVFMSWGSHAFKNLSNKFLRFTVNGHHHKGHVYIAVNGSDLYDVYLTTNRGNIVKEMKDIYFDELVERMDTEIERIAEYK